MNKITSRDNQKLKTARKVRDGRVSNLIFVEGLRLANEALEAGIYIQDAFVSDRLAAENQTLIRVISEREIATSVLSEKLLKTVADTKSPQGIVLVCERPTYSKESFDSALQKKRNAGEPVVLLHGINNPSNLGAIVRTSAAAGVSGLITTSGSTDVFSPKAIRGSMGACLKIQIWSGTEFEEAVKWATQFGLRKTYSDIKAGKCYIDVDWKIPRLLVMGSEAHGISEHERNQLDESVYIPMENNVESLNIAASCAVILYEAKRQSN